jgi:ankyrin repeat protein
MIEITEHIGRDHMDMCRFTGYEDVEYKKVEAAFQRMTSKASMSYDRISRRDKKIVNKKVERMQFLWNSLKFDQIDYRRMDIKAAHTKTCEWFLQSRCYLDWIDVAKLNQHAGLFWIKGKPGAGKSTLMKFTLGQAERMINADAIISFFFHARGVDLQKSTMGMYRSLLWQVLAKLPMLRSCFEDAGFVKHEDNGNSDRIAPQWSLEILKDLFERAVLAVNLPRPVSLVCFIDALDECEESQIRDTLSFFESLANKTLSSSNTLRVCLSSRHYPNITINCGLDLILERQAGHSQDITHYLNNKLKIGHSKLAEEMRQEVQKRASGVFMWVVLVVDTLNKEYDSGRIHALRNRLMNIPGDLHELFRDIMTRDELHRNELLLCIQWVLFSRRPLTPSELYFAILSGLGSDVIADLIEEDIEITTEDMQRFILDCSKGLVEIVSSESSTVQFIHESVRDFLLTKNGLPELWTHLGTDFQGISHDTLKQCCVTYLNIAISSIPGASILKDSQSAARCFPFLHYAVRNVLRHADLAEERHIQQVDFIEKFDWPNWIELSDLFLEHTLFRHTPNASPAYIFAEFDLPNLIETHPSCSSYFELEDERYGSPLLASIIARSYRVLRKFLELDVLRQPNVPLLRQLLNEFCSSKIKRHGPSSRISRRFTFQRGSEALNLILSIRDGSLVPFFLAAGKDMRLMCENWGSLILAAIPDRDERFALHVLQAGMNLNVEDSGAVILYEASSKGWREVVEEILSNGNVDVKTGNSQGMTPLCITVQRGYKEITGLLLDSGQVQVNSEDGKGRTPLAIACQTGNIVLARLLLATGNATVNSTDKFGQSPLTYAASRGYCDIVALLLQTKDIDVNSRDNSHRTPLSYAAERGHEEVVALLLANPTVDLNSKDRSSWSPLLHAACRGCERVVKLLLLQDKINVNLRCRTGYTALILAAREGHVAIVRLLLGRDDVDVTATFAGDISALSTSRNMGHEEVAKILIASGKTEDGEIRSTVATTQPACFSKDF